MSFGSGAETHSQLALHQTRVGGTNFSQQLIKYHSLDKDRDQQQIKEISSRYANNLIGRSIFALYLQDRGVVT